MQIKFGSEHAKQFVLSTIDYRVPLRGELYLGKYNKLYRLNEDRVQTRKAKKVFILKEVGFQEIK